MYIVGHHFIPYIIVSVVLRNTKRVSVTLGRGYTYLYLYGPERAERKVEIGNSPTTDRAEIGE